MAFENKIHIKCIGGLTTFLGSFLTFGTGIASLLPSKSSTMKINLIPTKKLALLSAVFCAAMLAFSQNASAVTFLTAGNEFGRTDGEIFVPSDAGKTSLVNHMIGMALSSFEPFTVDGQVLFVSRSSNNPNPPGPAVIGPSGTASTITIGSGIYSYVLATYLFRNTGLIQERVWYIGNFSGDVELPVDPNAALTGWTLFTVGGQGVPDGGTTVMLLGAALGALGMARRFLKA
jgi:hypothetical protein